MTPHDIIRSIRSSATRAGGAVARPARRAADVLARPLVWQVVTTLAMTIAALDTRAPRAFAVAAVIVWRIAARTTTERRAEAAEARAELADLRAKVNAWGEQTAAGNAALAASYEDRARLAKLVNTLRSDRRILLGGIRLIIGANDLAHTTPGTPEHDAQVARLRELVGTIGPEPEPEPTPEAPTPVPKGPTL